MATFSWIRMLLQSHVAFTMLHTLKASQTKTSKIVFIPFHFANSPYFNSLELAEEMLRRGNEVSILTTDLLRTRKSPVKHVQYQLQKRELAQELNGLIGKVIAPHGFLKTTDILNKSLGHMLDACFAMLKNNNTLEEIKKADLIVTISLTFCSYYVADIFDKPIVTLTTASYCLITHFTDGPSTPSNVPSFFSSYTDEMNFFARTMNFIMYKLFGFGMELLTNYYFRELQAAYGWKSKGSFSEIFAKTEMIISPLDFAYQYAHPLMPNIFYVGPFLARPPKALTDELEAFMQSSGEHGVVLISFGSSVALIDPVIVERVLTAISRMKQKFIWKLKSSEGMQIPKNLKVLKWISQNDILGHEKTRAFVSHMGLNGAAEAVYHGVPTVAAPFGDERIQNAILFAKKVKIAKVIDVLNADSETWQQTMEEVIYNSSYKEHALIASKQLRSWPKSSVERAGDLVQYTLDNGGRLPHLKSNANSLYWFQYYCVDVVAFLVAVLILVLYVFCKAMRLLFSLVCGSKSKSKKD